MLGKRLVCVALLVIAACAVSDARRGAVALRDAQHARTRMFKEIEITVSKQAASAIQAFLDEKSPVNDQSPKTWKEVFEAFNGKCTLSLHGGSACSLLRGKKPRDADSDYHCKDDAFLKILGGLDPELKKVEGSKSGVEARLKVLHEKDFDFEEFPKGMQAEKDDAAEREYTANGIRFNPLDLKGNKLKVFVYQDSDVEDCTQAHIKPAVHGALLKTWMKPKETSRVFKLKAKGFTFPTPKAEDIFWGTVKFKLAEGNFEADLANHVFHFLCQYCNPAGMDGKGKCELDTDTLGSHKEEKCKNMWSAISTDLQKKRTYKDEWLATLANEYDLKGVYDLLLSEIGKKSKKKK